jgi:hypothetical protein
MLPCLPLMAMEDYAPGVSYPAHSKFADLSRRLVLGSSSAIAAEVAYDIADDVADR